MVSARRGVPPARRMWGGVRRLAGGRGPSSCSLDGPQPSGSCLPGVRSAWSLCAPCTPALAARCLGCRVYYYWALQQERQGYVGADGGYHPPRWQLREMLIRGMHHLL